ncbi:transglycosylase SLT domain-containing protein [Thalassobacillus sp. CUG 92003]|uniref:transglycosylase SLT domain-containing protein n=1 Tax=Thalassobacillus sp. CUG 92003 TaxID=2736641 RepID=UPI0015E7B70D|nr:transglycosylase SLT domain-containing protein [Thalassobacillus sp. CUG 92003]
MKNIIYVGGVVIVATLAIVLTDKYNERANKSLENKNQKLQEQNEKFHNEKEYLQSRPTEYKKENGYRVWPEMEKKASRLVKESDGEFKKSWALYLVREADRYKIDPFLVYELLKVESGATFEPALVGPETEYGHAYGMAQFMKNTAPWVADMADLPYKEELLYDPYYSMQLSLVYLDFLHNKYGNWDEALTAYHRGIGGLEQFKEEKGEAADWYAKEIQNNARTHNTVASSN